MKKLLSTLSLLLLSVLFYACEKLDDEQYTGNTLEYTLHQGSEFEYQGKVIIKELTSGQLELIIELEGAKEDNAYFFPAHLHFGTYDSPDSKMAFMLNPVDIRDLKSQTVLGTLSNGETLAFESFQNFDGHIKVHLAESGPDYLVILAVGNIGANADENAAIDKDEISICLPSF